MLLSIFRIRKQLLFKTIGFERPDHWNSALRRALCRLLALALLFARSLKLVLLLTHTRLFCGVLLLNLAALFDVERGLPDGL